MTEFLFLDLVSRDSKGAASLANLETLDGPSILLVLHLLEKIKLLHGTLLTN